VAANGDVPSRSENVAAYAAATLATLVWVGTTLPGVVPVDPAAPADSATPMVRQTLLLIPALLLLVAGPVATVLARAAVTIRALLACGVAFVGLFAAGALLSMHPSDPVQRGIVGLFALVGVLAIRDAVVTVRRAGSGETAEASSGESSPPPGADLRLAIAILVLLAPSSLLAIPDLERASFVAPFAFVAIGGIGERFARRSSGLRLTSAILYALLSAHVVVTLRFALYEGGEDVTRWTWCGWATALLGAALLAANGAWVAILLRHRRRAPS
jgi:hypothetical protein